MASSVTVALGSPIALSTGQSYQVTVSEFNSTGALITGSYAHAVTLSTSDTTDTGFATTSTGSGPSSSVTIASSTQSVFFYYNGVTLHTPVTLTSSAASVPATSYVFTPGTTSTTSSSTGAIASLSVGPNGALPQIGSAGSFTLTVAGYTSAGSLVTGTYASPIVLTTTDSADLTFTVNGGSPSSSALVPSSSSIVVVNYDGASVPTGTTISVSSSGASGASFIFHPTSAGTSSTSPIAKLALAEVGAQPNQGTAGQFALSVTASDASGNSISGTYPSPIVITTNDSTDLQLATSSGGPFTPSVSITNSSTVVYVSYGGGDVPQSTEFAANSGSVMGILPFNPAVNTTQALYIKTLYITTSGAAPDTNSYGSQPIYINAYDQNGNIFNGTYPSAVRATLNSATELDLSIGSYVAATDCVAGSPPPNPCPNVAAQVVNNSGQVVFGNYAAEYASYPSQVSISTSGVSCAAINFPLASAATSGPGPATAPAGSSPYLCQAPNSAPTPTASPAASLRTGRGATYLVPIHRT